MLFRTIILIRGPKKTKDQLVECKISRQMVRAEKRGNKMMMTVLV